MKTVTKSSTGINPRPSLVNPFTDREEDICGAEHVIPHEGGVQCYLTRHPESPWHWDDFLGIYWTEKENDPYGLDV